MCDSEASTVCVYFTTGWGGGGVVAVIYRGAVGRWSGSYNQGSHQQCMYICRRAHTEYAIVRQFPLGVAAMVVE